MEFDLIVIGAGPGGYTAAIKAAQLGIKTAIIEKENNLGGTCLNVGCIPSKALLSSSELYQQAKHHFKNHGIHSESLSIDVEAMMKRKEGVIRKMARGIDYLIKKNNIEHFSGTGRIISSSEVEVDQGKQKKNLKTKRILIATGSKVSGLPFLDFDGNTVLSSDHAISLNQTPDSMVVIGGGAIGLELGSVWARLGTKVDIIESLPRIATIFDQDVTQPLQKLLQKQGVKFHLNTRVEAAEKTKNGIKITTSNKDKKNDIEAEKVLVAVGRKPNTENLGLEEIKITLDEKGCIQIDENWQTNISGIYAIGDVVTGPMLAHKAEQEAIAVVERIAGKAGQVNYNTIPWVIYTSPEVAAVGLTEMEAIEKGFEVSTGIFPFQANGRAVASDHSDGLAKIISNKANDRVLGAQILSANASELIAEAVLLMEFEGSTEDLARTIHAHPTMSEGLREAAHISLGEPLHM
ncbi:MAG: dihydrolipoyl dehydrogenase [Limisphaerales bacterium]|nr:dihydrolipoyl dehydrogenase [Verrucomicrobiales bacterium]RZO61274.1 MAG: dihydrolipoyl dehydrogenase [Limisphaerales bacterium]|tara:strand:- start:9173 stop:10564 length:1392 start_codon:yes stop_codon:yes gene_type:complete